LLSFGRFCHSFSPWDWPSGSQVMAKHTQQVGISLRPFRQFSPMLRRRHRKWLRLTSSLGRQAAAGHCGSPFDAVPSWLGHISAIIGATVETRQIICHYVRVKVKRSDGLLLRQLTGDEIGDGLASSGSSYF
jgi:hypothetical protein